MFLVFGSSVFADDIQIPVTPIEPSVDTSSFKSFNQVQEIKVSALVSVHSSGDKMHLLVLPKMDTLIEVFSGDFSGKKGVKLGDIFSLEIISWSGNEDRDGSFIFYPDRYILTLKSGEKINVNKNIPLFNKIRIASDKGEDILFTCFYDYYRNGVWVNRDEKSADRVSSVPVKGCVTAFKVN